MSPGFPSASPGSRSGFCFGRAFSCPPGAGLVLFLCQYLPARRALYGYNGTVGPDGAMVRVLLPGHPDAPLPPPALWAAALFSGAGPLPGRVAVYHFLCHYQGGRSIYRMRLLPQFGELWRRCLSAPALALLLGAALTAAVILLCALCYYHLTPAGHLPPEPWGGLPLGWIGGNHA